MKCKQCINETIGNRRQGYNNNKGKNKTEILHKQLGGTIRYNTQINKRNRDLKNQGFIDSQKYNDCMRILAVNPRGFGPDKEEKVNMLKKAIVDYEIDVVLLSGTDRKWNESTMIRMKRMMKSVNKNVELIASDSGEDTKLSGGYLPGGTLSILTGRIAGIINKENVRRDKLGRWSSVRIEGETKRMQIINMYRITDLS